jgi:hypothetical protein
MGRTAPISMPAQSVIKTSPDDGPDLSALWSRPLAAANSRPRQDFQFDQPLAHCASEIIFSPTRSLDAADIRKVDRAVGLYACGRVELRMIDDADGDHVRRRENATAASRRRRAGAASRRALIKIAGRLVPIVACLRSRAADGSTEPSAPPRPAVPPRKGASWAGPGVSHQL